MDYLAAHRQILQLAAAGQIPGRIDENSELSNAACRELYEAGLIGGVDARTKDGTAFLNARITIAGREYLNDLEQRAAAASPTGMAKRWAYVVGGAIGGIVTTVITAWIVVRLGLADG